MKTINYFKDPDEIVVVNGLFKNTSPNFISNAYSMFGKIKHVFIPKLPDGSTKSYCYVIFHQKSIAQTIIKKYPTFEISDLTLTNNPFNREEFDKNDANSDDIFLYDDDDANFDDENIENHDIFEPPFHDFTSAYFQRPDRADTITPIDISIETLSQSIDMSKIEQFYNHGFVNDSQENEEIEKLLANIKELSN